MSRRWAWQDAPAAQQIAEIASVLRAGGVILLPTDTIYGLHAVATNARAVARISQIKGREETKPFVVLCASLEQVDALGGVIEPRIRQGLETIWPGPVTAVIPLDHPTPASRGASTQAIRIPRTDWLLQLLRQTGPLVSTSANRSGEPPIATPADLPPEIDDAVDGVANAGRQEGEPSLIVDLSGPEPILIRESNRAFTQEVWKTLRKSL